MAATALPVPDRAVGPAQEAVPPGRRTALRQFLRNVTALFPEGEFLASAVLFPSPQKNPPAPRRKGDGMSRKFTSLFTPKEP